MIIVSEKQVKGRLQDGLDTIFSMSDDDFNEMIQRLKRGEFIMFFYLTDDCEIPNGEPHIGVESNMGKRSYFGGERIPKWEFWNKLQEVVKQKGRSANDKNKANIILDACGLSSFMECYARNKQIPLSKVEQAFNVLLDEKVLYAFLQTSPSMQDICVDGKTYNKRDVFEVLGSIFKCPTTGKFASFDNETSGFLITNDYILTENYTKLYNSPYNLDRFAKLEYTFNSMLDSNGMLITRVVDGEWKLNDALRFAVYDDMPEELTTEEKVFYIYAKLCDLLCYEDDVARIEGRRVPMDERSEFNKEYLECVQPNSQVICYEFSRVCAKFLNELDGVTAKVLAQGMVEGHFVVGCYTDNISAYLEAVNVSGTANMNDLARAKNKLPLEGVMPVSDKYRLINRALEKVYPCVYGTPKTSIEEYLKKINLQKQPPVDFESKIDAFVNVLKNNNVCGNEGALTFNAFKTCGFFGQNVEAVYIGERSKSKSGTFYKRKILVRQENEENPYLIDVVNLTSRQLDVEEVKQKLQSGEYVYESDTRKLKGVENGL